jgi:hypothetical protein
MEMETENQEEDAKKNRLARECSKLNKEEEQELADVGLAADFADEPEY